MQNKKVGGIEVMQTGKSSIYYQRMTGKLAQPSRNVKICEPKHWPYKRDQMGFIIKVLPLV